jgi:hypothetical protein
MRSNSNASGDFAGIISNNRNRDTVALVRTIIETYIQEDHTIIGVVMAMNGKNFFAGDRQCSNARLDDPANAGALNLARAVDPNGKRTIGACPITYLTIGCSSYRML